MPMMQIDFCIVGYCTMRTVQSLINKHVDQDTINMLQKHSSLSKLCDVVMAKPVEEVIIRSCNTKLSCDMLDNFPLSSLNDLYIKIESAEEGVVLDVSIEHTSRAKTIRLKIAAGGISYSAWFNLYKDIIRVPMIFYSLEFPGSEDPRYYPV